MINTNRSEISVEMGYDLELPMAYMRRDLLEKYSEEEVKKLREDLKLWIEDVEKMEREKKARDELIKRDELVKKRDEKVEDYNAEEMKMIAKEKMVGRRRERLMRQSLRRRQTAIQKNSKSAEESFTSDSDEEMKMALEEVKRLMEKAIQENITAARDDGDAAKKEDSKAEEMNNTNDDGDAAKEEEDEKMFPRRRGRLIRYLRRQRSTTSQDSAFQIEFQPPESLMSYSDESDEMNKAELVDRERINEAHRSVLMGKQMHDSPSAALSKTNISDAVDISEESEVSGSDKEDSSWISWFCNLRGNKFLCEVDDYYILDDFNLCGLSHQVPYYDYALDLILDEESSSHGEVITEEQNELIESAAEMLYGMIHARYILTGNGLNSMYKKYKNYDFGRCPKVYCRGQPCLPVGLSDIPRASTVKIYCPKCEDVYYPPSKYQGSILCCLPFDIFPVFWFWLFFKHVKTDIDGAFFGTTFSHLFVMTYDFMMPEKVSQSYVPRVFGFKLHKR